MKHKYLHTTKEKLINQIKIAKKSYKIYLCEGLKLNNISLDGYVDLERKDIYLRKTKNKKETLIHEITHIFLHEISKVKRMKNKKKIKTLRDNEVFIEALRYLIMQNFKLKNGRNI